MHVLQRLASKGKSSECCHKHNPNISTKSRLTEQIGLDMELRVCEAPLLRFEQALLASQTHRGGLRSVVLRPASTSQKMFLSGSKCLHQGYSLGLSAQRRRHWNPTSLEQSKYTVAEHGDHEPKRWRNASDASINCWV